jgi:hypothetical protein
MPILTYGVDTWMWTKADTCISTLTVAEMRFLRNGGKTIRERIRNENSTENLKLNYLGMQTTKEQRMRLYGHILRMNEDCILNYVLYMKVRGKCPRGRLKSRWDQKFTKDVIQKEGRTWGAIEEAWLCSYPHKVETCREVEERIISYVVMQRFLSF